VSHARAQCALSRARHRSRLKILLCARSVIRCARCTACTSRYFSARWALRARTCPSPTLCRVFLMVTLRSRTSQPSASHLGAQRQRGVTAKTPKEGEEIGVLLRARVIFLKNVRALLPQTVAARCVRPQFDIYREVMAARRPQNLWSLHLFWRVGYFLRGGRLLRASSPLWPQRQMRGRPAYSRRW
jgi:hypothetical protein